VFQYPYRVATPDEPPAGFVLLNIRGIGSDEGVTDLAALADTGADQTVIPTRIAEQLGLIPSRHVHVSGFDGVGASRPVYLIRLIVRDLPEIEVPVIGAWQFRYAILGRDVLNLYRVVFDGPNQRLEISL